MKRRSLIISLVAIVVISVGGVIATLVTDTKPQLGLDLQGGASVTLQPVGKADPEALTVVTDILRNRIDSLGVAEPEIIRQGNTVIVNLPGIKDQDRAIQLVGQTGKVLFRPVLSETSAAAVAAAASSTTTVPESASSTPDAGATTVAPSTTGGHDRERLPARLRRLARRGHDDDAVAPGRGRSPPGRRTSARAVVLPRPGRQTVYQLGPAFALARTPSPPPRPACRTASGWSTSSSGGDRTSGRGTPGRRSATARRPTARLAAWPSCSTARYRRAGAPDPVLLRHQRPGLGRRQRLPEGRGQGPGPRAQVRQCAGRAEAPGGPDRVGHVGQGLAARRPDRRLRRRPARAAPDDPLLPGAGHPGRGRPVSGRLPAVDLHLDPVEDVGSLSHPGRRHWDHRVDRHHGRLLRRVPGAPQDDVRSGSPAGVGASRARGARSWRPTSCR